MRKLKEKLKSKILENFFYLFFLKGFDLILPFLIMPYLVKTLGSSKYGSVVFAQSLINYFAILINFGFDIYGTREIASNIDNKENLKKIFSSILLIKAVLFFVSILLIFLLVFTVDKFYTERALFILTSLILVYHTLSITWFFQGIEEMKYISFLNIVSKVIFTVLIFILVKNSTDYLLVPVLNATGGAVASILGLFLVYKNFKITFSFPSLIEIKEHLKNSFQFFISRVFSTLYTNTNTFIIGLFLNYHAVTVYDIAFKLYSMLKIPWDIFNSVLYPNITKTKNTNLLKKSIILSFSTAVFVYIITWFTVPLFIELLFGKDLIDATFVFRILNISLIFSSVHILLGTSTLVAFGYAKHFNLSVVLSTVFYFFVILFLILADKLTLTTISISVVLTVLFILIYRAYFVYKYRLL